MNRKQSLQKLNNFVLFDTGQGKVNIDVFFADDTIWLTQRSMAGLFGVSSQNITMHLKNIFKEEELDVSSTCKKFLQVQKEGVRSDYPILDKDNKGKISAKKAKTKAKNEYKKFQKKQDKEHISDFDEEKKYLKGEE